MKPTVFHLALSLFTFAACGGTITTAPTIVLPADCAPTGLGCFSSCPDGSTCAYVYTGEWPDPGSGCSMYTCATHPAAIKGCNWVEWSDVGAAQSSTEGFVCGDGPSPTPVNSCVYPGCG